MKKLSIFLFFVCLIFFNSTRILASEQEELDVMIIEINPTIKKIDSSIYPDNHPKVTDYFQQSVDGTIKELKEDLESTSHGYLKVNIVEHEYLDEYPKYNKQITLNNGTQAYQLDEETYLAKSGYDGSPIGDWYNLYSSGIFDEIPAYSFDYDYIIDKYDLIEKRENGDFEQLWLITIDPAQTFETIMVGQNPFWINGPGYVASCPNFMIINVSVSRRDANLHALGHGVEGTMTAIFSDEYETINGYGDRGTYRKYNPSFNTYNKDVVDINKTNYADLNYWEKYTLGIFSNKDEYTSVGNIHFPFNGTSDYDYSNSQKVYTNWKEWLDYPNINGKFELDDNTAWLLNAGNDKLGDDENKDPDRLYSRFWFYLMPHIEGYTKEGIWNNWWKYFTSLDFVTKIEPSSKETTYEFFVDDEIKIPYMLTYNSGKKELKNLEGQYLNVNFTGDNLKVVDNKLIAVKEGITNLTVYHDNQELTFKIKTNKQIKKYSCEFNDNNYYGKLGNIITEEEFNIQCKTHTCEIIDENYFGKLGNIITKEQYNTECSNKENNPNTGIFIPLGSTFILLIIGIVIYFYTRHNNHMI